jgi:hypothetical protein
METEINKENLLNIETLGIGPIPNPQSPIPNPHKDYITFK